jgi:hypothetical protein
VKRVCALWVTCVRWSARTIALILAAFVLLFIVGEGPPPLYVLAPWLVVLAGFALGWRYEALGGVLILAGFIWFNVAELRATGHLLRFGAFHLLLIPAVLFLVAWCGQLLTSETARAPAPRRSAERPADQR